MQKLAIYGKGGIGKSTLSANLSLCYAQRGKRVLHIGCDPKHDSTLLLTHGVPAVPMSDLMVQNPHDSFSLERIIARGVAGIDCVESGGPEPGVGCGGWIIARLIDIFQDNDVLSSGYDLILFDVLGDVVCGGFANPMRQGYADQVVIVMSEEILSMYAANNIAKAVVRFHSQGLRLLGLVVNRRDNASSLDMVNAFAERLNAKILAVLPRDPAAFEAERHVQTIVEFNPDAPLARQIRGLAESFFDLPPDAGTIPTPMNDTDLLSFFRSA